MDPQANLSSETIACNLTTFPFKRQLVRGVSLRTLGIGVQLDSQSASASMPLSWWPSPPHTWSLLASATSWPGSSSCTSWLPPGTCATRR